MSLPVCQSHSGQFAPYRKHNFHRHSVNGCSLGEAVISRTIPSALDASIVLDTIVYVYYC